VTTFGSADATPDITGGNRFKTAAGTYTITDFDGAVDNGHKIEVQTGGPFTTYECDVIGPLRCGVTGSDLETIVDEMTTWTKDGAVWRLTGYVQSTFGPKQPHFSYITMPESDSVTVGDPQAGFGRYWVANQVPTRPYFTDDTDTPRQLAYGGTEFRECQRTITTEQVGDVLMCEKAQGAVTINNLTCVALGGTVPDDQKVEIVECEQDGSACVVSGFFITASAIETHYGDNDGADPDIDQFDWWGIKFISIGGGTGFKADYLHCQVGYDAT
jgi:hypothetical protein